MAGEYKENKLLQFGAFHSNEPPKSSPADANNSSGPPAPLQKAAHSLP
jgi:hypothetical protein